MKRVKHIVRKEFLQIRRNRQMLPIIFGIPIFQLLVLVYAATFEIKIVDTVIVDHDKSTYSGQLKSKFSATGRFNVLSEQESDAKAVDFIRNNDARMALVIPRGFEKDMIAGQNPELQIILDAVDGSAAGVIQSYAAKIIMNFNKNILMSLSGSKSYRSGINIIDRFWYNPDLNYKYYMVPGILSILVTIIGMFLTAMNIVREKEIGTIEQLNVTPIKKHEFILGKLIPFWIIGLFELAFGLVVAKLLFEIPIEGNLLLLFAMAGIYLLVILSFGMLVSTITETQQQSMFIAFFFMIIFILMSGLFTPVESMPDWAQKIAFLNPVTHFMKIMRRVILKGAGFADILEQFTVLSVYGIGMLAFAVNRYKKTGA